MSRENSLAAPHKARLGEHPRGEVGAATEVAREALDNPSLIPVLIECLEDTDVSVVAHAAHALMQISRDRPQIFDPLADRLIDILGRQAQWEIGEQVPKVLAECDLTRDRAAQLAEILLKQLDGKSAIAAASALSALQRLKGRGLIEAKPFEKALASALQSKSKALAARARRLRQAQPKHG